MKSSPAKGNKAKIAALLLLLFCVWTLACSGISAEDETLNKAQKNLPMEPEKTYDAQVRQIHLQTVSFSAPEGFEDKSSNSIFIKPKYSDDLKKRLVGGEPEKVFAVHLNRGTKTSGSKDAIEIKDIESARKSFHSETEGLREAGRELYGIKNASIKIDSFMDDQSLSKRKFPMLMTGRMMSETGGETEYKREAFVFDTKSTFFYLSYVTVENGAEIKKRFERMVESMELNTPEFTGDSQPTADDYIRRYSGNVTLEVPTDLIPDREFKYERYGVPDATARESSKIVRLTSLEPDDQEKLRELFEKDKQKIDPKYFDGDIESSKEFAVETKYYTGKTEKYFTTVNKSYEKINPSLVFRTVTLLGRFRDKSGNVIILIGKAPLEKEKELDDEFERWTQTFVPASARSSDKQ